MQQNDDYHLEARRRDDRVELAVRGRIEVGNAERLIGELERSLRPMPRKVVLDLGRVDYFDSAGGAVLIRLRRLLEAEKVALEIAATTPAIDGFLSLVDQERLLHPTEPRPRRVSLATHVGEAALQAVRDSRALVSFTGEMALGILDAVRRPHRIRWRETLLYMQRAGADGLPIVALISYLMGLITAFQAAIQLQQFGADIYVANLVGLSITRELGPLMTAIIAAGRSGAAFAAEIGTMKVADEVDALTTMGLDRTRFLVTPKVLALVTMLPCLTLFADLVGVLGGLTVAVLWLDIPASVYMSQMAKYMIAWDVIQGLVKAVAFATLIAGVGCMRGFQARGGAESVGRITTSAIVAGLFFIILADAVFTLLFHYWDFGGRAGAGLAN